MEEEPVTAREATEAKQATHRPASVMDDELPTLLPESHRGAHDHVETLRVDERALLEVEDHRPSAGRYAPEREIKLPGVGLIDLAGNRDARTIGELKLRELVRGGAHLVSILGPAIEDTPRDRSAVSSQPSIAGPCVEDSLSWIPCKFLLPVCGSDWVPGSGLLDLLVLPRPAVEQ
jgi:hypothetical protein